MTFDRPLIPATLVQRYKRFLADVTLEDGRLVTAHVANPGKMTGLADPGQRVWLEPNDDPKRKLKYSWKLAETGGLVGVDTGRANALVDEALRAGVLTEFGPIETIRSEVRYGEKSRVDFLLNESLYLEVKSVTLSRTPGLAEFPDTKTTRGARHMDELAAMVRAGFQAAVLFVVQRDDCDRMQIAADIDPAYTTALRSARAAGVQVLCRRCTLSAKAITLSDAIPFA